MIFLKYKEPQAEHVQFQRLISGLLTLFFALTENIVFVEVFIILNIISFITTVRYSPTTMLFKFLSFLYGKSIFTTPSQYVHSYRVQRLTSILEDLMRIGGGFGIFYVYQISPTIALLIAMFMAIAMLISSFFGFCLSALMHIGYKALLKKFGQ